MLHDFPGIVTTCKKRIWPFVQEKFCLQLLCPVYSKGKDLTAWIREGWKVTFISKGKSGRLLCKLNLDLKSEITEVL